MQMQRRAGSSPNDQCCNLCDGYFPDKYERNVPSAVDYVAPEAKAALERSLQYMGLSEDNRPSP